MNATMTALHEPASDEYEPTDKDMAEYSAWLDTVNLVNRLRQAKEHMPASEWLDLMLDLGRLSSEELRKATERPRPYAPLPPMWKGDTGELPSW